MALIGQPKILLLDEPTSALDPESRREVWSLLEMAKKMDPNLLCLLTTHHLEEAEILADDVAILCDGQLIFHQSIDQLKKEFGFSFVVDVFPASSNKYPKPNELDGLATAFADKIGQKNIIRKKNKVTIKVPISDDNESGQLIKSIKQQVPQGYEVAVNSNSLEQAYLSFLNSQQTMQASLNVDHLTSVLDRLNNHKRPKTARKLFLLTVIKFVHILSDVLEVVKLVIVYGVIILTVYFVFTSPKIDHVLDPQKKLLVCICVQIFFEIMISTWPPQNIVYEKAFEIKSIFYTNAVSPLVYYSSKLINDLLVLFLPYLLIFLTYKHVCDETIFAFFKQYFALLIFWKFSYLNMSYLLSQLFKDTRSVLKYFAIVYGMIGMIVNIVQSLLGIPVLGYLSDFSTLIKFISELSPTHSTAKLVGLCSVLLVQGLAYSAILVFFESYNLRFNFVDSSVSFAEPKSKLTNTFMEEGVRQAAAQAENDHNPLRAMLLKKKYNKVFAVRGVSFGVEQGHSFGLVGPNGAGKSTIFGMLLGRVKKDSGRVVLGHQPRSCSALPFDSLRAAVCFQSNSCYEDVTVRRQLQFFCSFFGASMAAAEELCLFLDFAQHLKKTAG